MLPTLLKAGFMEGTQDIPINVLIKTVFELRNSNNKVIILKSSTGSGKSTVLPAMLGQKLEKKIISAQPRILTAKQLPDQIIKDYPYKLGKDIGYHTGDYQIIPRTGIIFVTNGILANYLLSKSDKEICDNYDVILIDEAHEIDSFGTSIHFFLRNFIERNCNNDKCPIVIITSATFDYNHFAKYYETKIIYKVKGFTYPIREEFLKYTSKNYIEDTVNIIEKINSNPVPEEYKFTEGSTDRTLGDDILIFFPGKPEMEEAEKLIKQRKIPVTVCLLNSRITNAEDQNYRNIFLPATAFETERKVILSTNVGEVGVTFPYIKHVIDTGFYKPKIYLPDIGCYNFDKQPISNFSSKQRKGRVGRISPGNYYGIFTKEAMNAMRKDFLISLYYEDISVTILYLLTSIQDDQERSINLFELNLIYKPSPISVWNSLEKLYILGFINAELETTHSGKLALQIPRLSLEQIKVIFSGYVHGGSIPDLIIIALALDEEIYEKKNKPKSLFARESLCDFIPFVEDFYTSKLPIDVQQRFYIMRDTIIESLAKLGLNPFENIEKGFPNHGDDYYSTIKQCLYEGLRLNLCTLVEGTYYKTPKGLKIFKRLCGNYFVYSNLEYVTAYFENGEIKKKEKIKGKSILDGFINISKDFY